MKPCQNAAKPTSPPLRLAIVQPTGCALTETFIRAHAEHLPARVTVIHDIPPCIEGRPVFSQSIAARAARKSLRGLSGRSEEMDVRRAYSRAFRANKVDAVLAEYGPMGASVADVCRSAKLPLIVMFHGYDASRYSVLKAWKERYHALFETAAGIVAVSRAMQSRLISMGAPEHNVHYNPYGVDCSRFHGALPGEAAPTLIAAGRFTEKKAPYLTILAFAEAWRQYPKARLRMIGDGPLLEVCRDLTRALGLADAVTFLGAQPHEVVQEEMRRARAFVQHSIEASDGDSEGTPVAILEAGASGLPVIATYHGGIPDVVIDEKTGLLVAERDVAGMAQAMIRVIGDPALAGAMGHSASHRIAAEFSMERSITRLWSIIESCVHATNNKQ